MLVVVVVDAQTSDQRGKIAYKQLEDGEVNVGGAIISLSIPTRKTFRRQNQALDWGV